ncbi:hypothetical protein M752DRAFT_266762 [Aspergillus phoenicis ATCC 13157]|uniref:Uncharacterized protein n=1 Tax=Aspergillus phoenicis ATCC 13157 TaxID=1353007 RepID=A0A370PIU8_ASPPH|nr:hypothetical protein M752DRAFT_266762 [Aspergillus phoenicis ATCC 13157]
MLFTPCNKLICILLADIQYPALKGKIRKDKVIKPISTEAPFNWRWNMRNLKDMARQEFHSIFAKTPNWSDHEQIYLPLRVRHQFAGRSKVSLTIAYCFINGHGGIWEHPRRPKMQLLATDNALLIVGGILTFGAALYNLSPNQPEGHEQSLLSQWGRPLDSLPRCTVQ